MALFNTGKTSTSVPTPHWRYNGMDEHVVIPDTVTCIYDEQFYKCTSLKSVVIPDSVTYIGECAFEGCTSLEKVQIGSGVKRIESGAFMGCSSLKSIVIPGTVLAIGSAAFCGCTSLEMVQIGDGVEMIGGSSFDGCTSLKSIVIPDTVVAVGSWAFYKCKSLEKVTIGKMVNEIEQSAFLNCSSLHTVEVAEGNSTFFVIDGMLCTTKYNETCVIFYPAGKKTVSLVIPDTVDEIEWDAFEDCAIDSITLPKKYTNCISFRSKNLKYIHYNGSFTQLEEMQNCNAKTLVTSITPSAPLYWDSDSQE